MKRPGVGWPRCCPPDGSKAAIVRALEPYMRASTPPGRTQPLVPDSPPRACGYNRYTLLPILVVTVCRCYSTAAASSSSKRELDSMPVAQLKRLAEEVGVKRPGVGWPTCCPPDGNKAAIVNALNRALGGVLERDVMSLQLERDIKSVDQGVSTRSGPKEHRDCTCNRHGPNPFDERRHGEL